MEHTHTRPPSATVISLIIFCFLYFLGVQTISAQDQTANSTGMSLGAKLLLNTSSFNDLTLQNERPHTEYKPGFGVGGYVLYSLSGNLSIQSELLYFQQGGTLLAINFNDPLKNEITTSRITLHNIEIPVLFQMNFPQLVGSFQPKVMLGGAVAYNIAAWESFDKTIIYPVNNAITVYGTENVSADYTPFQFGAYVGIGVTSGALSVDLRYRHGINPVNATYSLDNLINTGSDIQSHSVAMSIGLKIF